jgi:hypothetical protein
MYPNRELTRLAARKAALRWDIALRRVQCAEAAARVARPLAWLDRMLAFWRQLSPLAQFAAVPLGLLIKRTIFPRRNVLRSLVRWGPFVFGAARAITSVVKTRVESSKSPGDRSRRPFVRPYPSRAQ